VHQTEISDAVSRNYQKPVPDIMNYGTKCVIVQTLLWLVTIYRNYSPYELHIWFIMDVTHL